MSEFLSRTRQSNQRENQSSFKLVKLCYQKQQEDAKSVDTSNLAAKIDFTALKGKVGKLDIIIELVTVLTGLTDLKTKLDDLDIGKLMKFIKKRVYNKRNRKVNNLENKILDGTTLIHINQ